MKTRAEFFRERWCEKTGVTYVPPQRLDVSSLRETEWCPEFEQLMRNRLVMGAFRYGLMRAKGKPKYDRLESISKRLEQYASTGNDELLVDVANLALMEFVEGTHPRKHFSALDGAQSTHVMVKEGTSASKSSI